MWWGDSQAVESPEALAEKIGCSASFEEDTTEKLFVEAVGKCTIGGEEVRLLNCANNDARNHFEEIARQFGARYVKGDGFLVEVHSSAMEDEVEKELG